ncbi:hypothetical protein H6P81_000213 [Aristolochia fimbriata]|uniref:Uncharacterized protein n=1 Tax=Aristolochia fimbriata TaxID=158543 RepID=A0AAV7F3G8_ARIFI|nr:hypothetical protein H6P81_000213 [Aristolochia fimbriata]
MHGENGRTGQSRIQEQRSVSSSTSSPASLMDFQSIQTTKASYNTLYRRERGRKRGVWVPFFNYQRLQLAGFICCSVVLATSFMGYTNWEDVFAHQRFNFPELRDYKRERSEDKDRPEYTDSLALTAVSTLKTVVQSLAAGSSSEKKPILCIA